MPQNYSPRTMQFLAEGLGEMFEGEFADICANKFLACVDGGRSRPVERAPTGSEDPQDIMFKIIIHILFFFFLSVKKNTVVTDKDKQRTKCTSVTHGY